MLLGAALAASPSWVVDVGEAYDLAAIDGVVLVLRESDIIGVRDGRVAWTRPLSANEGWIATTPSGCSVVGLETGELTCVSHADGSLRWTIPVPSLDSTPTNLQVGTSQGTGVIVQLADGRWAKVEPSLCPGPCLSLSEPLIRMPFWLDGVSANPAGVRARHAHGAIVLYDVAGQRLAAVKGEYTFFATVRGDGKVVAGIDDTLVLLDGPACTQELGFTLAEAPPGCARTLGAVHNPGFPVLIGDDVVLVTDRELKRFGTSGWTSAVDAAGLPALSGATIYVGCWQPSDGFVTHVDLCAVDANTGRQRWRATVGGEKLGFLDNPIVLADSGMVYLSTPKRLVAFRAD